MVKRLEILGEDSACKRLAEESAQRVGSFLQKFRTDNLGDGRQSFPAWFLVALGGILQVKAWEKSVVFRELLIGIPSGEDLSRYVDSLLMRDNHLVEGTRFAVLLNEILHEKYALSVLRTESKNRKFELVMPTTIEASIEREFAELLWDCHEIVCAGDSSAEVSN